LFKSVVFPTLLAIFYFVAIMPVGLIIRLAGKDLLRQKFDDNAKSYWLKRTKPIASMKSQY
jgi:hypothetical protein